MLEVLDWHAAKHPERLHVTVLEDDTTYGQLAKSARTVAAGLIEHDVVPGDRIKPAQPNSERR
jgi:non-ribosomal peptide synthetase component E (peptide arylation enzyme)